MNPSTTFPAPALATPLPFRHSLAGKAVLAVAASLFVAACAHLSVPLPFTPVPLTMSDLAVLLVGLTLTPGTAFAALALYLLEGATGLPVFSRSGPGGVLQLLHWFSSGFLLSYPLAAATAGSLQRVLRFAVRSEFALNLIAATAASALLMLCGALWLGAFLHLSPAATLAKATFPFLPGQIVKVFAAAGIVTSARRLRRA